MREWVTLGVSLLLFLAAAKTHGRQLRLERELHGHVQVQFGTGQNHPWVEALWRRDRIRFWTLTILLGAASIGLALAADALGAAVIQDAGRPALFLGLVGPLLWSPILCFQSLAVLSLRRSVLARRHQRMASPTPAWRKQAVQGTVFWFMVNATGLLALLTLVLL